jgi:Family of unknown function (DUF6283)
MTEVRVKPCGACPYRKDVPSGVWAAEEYDKLRPYDNPTAEQPFQGFSCHATPEYYCHGWAVVHTSRGHAYDLIALRFSPPSTWPEPCGIELFDSGNEAADHGQAEAELPGAAALAAIERLTRRYERLHEHEGQRA